MIIFSKYLNSMNITLKIYEYDFPEFDELDLITLDLATLNSKNIVYIKDIKFINDQKLLIVMTNKAGYNIKTYLESNYNDYINPSSLIIGSVFEFQEILTERDDFILIKGTLI